MPHAVWSERKFEHQLDLSTQTEEEMAKFFSQEHRPLKRKREEKGNWGAPDVFPQDKNQKEDDLSSDNVKKGFQALPVFQDDTEYGSIGKGFAQSHNHNMSHNMDAYQKRLKESFVGILTKKADSNVISDKGDRKKVGRRYDNED